jgi:molecular chaperone GrpE
LDASIAHNGKAENGLVSVRDQLIKTLSGHGLAEIKSLGEKFNPEYHEAVEQVEAAGKEGTVSEEIQKGYLLNGKVLRVAKVRVIK